VTQIRARARSRNGNLKLMTLDCGDPSKRLHIFFFFLTFVCSIGIPFALHSQPSREDHYQKKALIFGVAGQDGIYLTELLLSKNYEVHGVKRPFSTSDASVIDDIYQEAQMTDRPFFLHTCDLLDSICISQLIQTVQPDEIYNFAAQSHVNTSFEFPEYTAEVNALGALRILEAVRQLGLSKKIKFYQASTSELFGLAQEIPQTETTPHHPRSPYGVAKLFAYWTTVNYREAYGIFACNGILFNHESPYRGESFVTQKIAMAACRYKLGLQDVLYLGNLDVKRDWGYAKDYVEAMWLMLQQDQPDDYVIATGELHSIREFVELAYELLGIEISWHGTGLDEYGVDTQKGNIIVRVDPRFYRPSEVFLTLGNADKAAKNLKWKPKTHFYELLKIMVEAAFQKVSKEKAQS
jgi:GDPmannose 4,6-dehydratase